jgi:Tfp pilus assembly protein PilE
MKIYPKNETQRAKFTIGKARGFTLIQLLGMICIIGALTSMVVASIRAVAGRGDAASDAQMARALENTNGSATWAVTNHNEMTRQADRALEMIK